MTVVHIEVAGKMIPASDASWYQVAPCGCTCGATVAQMPLGGEVRTDGEAAFGEGLTAAERKKDKASGFTYELGHRSEVVDRMAAKCQHIPRWGIEPRPEVDGYRWAGNYDSKVQHLAPKQFVATDDEPIPARATGRIAALCGSDSYSWSNRWPQVDGKVECKRCLRAATQAAA